VNVLVTCKEVGTMTIMFYIVVVSKVTKTSTGVYSLMLLKNIDVELHVSISTPVLTLSTNMTTKEFWLKN
jgi:hypothetical protein